MTLDNSRRLLLMEEVAEKLRMPLNTVRYKRQQGHLPFLFKLGARVVAYESDVDAWIEEQRDRQVKENAS